MTRFLPAFRRESSGAENLPDIGLPDVRSAIGDRAAAQVIKSTEDTTERCFALRIWMDFLHRYGHGE
jgi:hypothetical protein